MKKVIKDFFLRGLVTCGFGPLVLAVLYLILGKTGVIGTLTPERVSIGIFSLTALAFIAGGTNAVYQIERLPLMVAILIHGAVLYLTYLATYLINDWLELGATPVLVFSAIFVVGYFAIWGIIYRIIKKNTHKVNEMLKEKQRSAENQ